MSKTIVEKLEAEISEQTRLGKHFTAGLLQEAKREIEKLRDQIPTVHGIHCNSTEEEG